MEEEERALIAFGRRPCCVASNEAVGERVKGRELIWGYARYGSVGEYVPR